MSTLYFDPKLSDSEKGSDFQDDFLPEKGNHQTNLLFAEAIEKARSKVIVGVQEVPIVSLEHLIAMKMVTGEPKDDKDVKDLLKAQTINYDRTKAIVEEYLGGYVADRLDIFAGEVGILAPRGPYIYRKTE